MRPINLIVIHCSASHCTSTLTPDQLTAEHRARGFAECGYHYYIATNGTLHTMRDVGKVGAHALGFNANSIGIAYEGGLTDDGSANDTRTPEQCQTLRELLRTLMATYPRAFICGHRELSPDLNFNGTIEPCEFIKMCPCFDASIEYADLMADAIRSNGLPKRT